MRSIEPSPAIPWSSSCFKAQRTTRNMIRRHLLQTSYAHVSQEMLAFSLARDADTPDELWLIECDPVITLGLAADPRHILRAGDIPVLQTDRGGEVTYHGPGQLLVFPLLDLRRQGRMVRETVRLYEQIVIDWVVSLGMSTACRWQGEPGLYHRGVDGVLEKFAALGLRIRKGCTTHGLAINLDTDLLAFERINPCGHAGLGVTDLATLGMNVNWQTAADALGDRFDEAFQR